MATPNEDAIEMAVDYLLSADGSSPIEVQLSFLKSRMKMAPQEIAEAAKMSQELWEENYAFFVLTCDAPEVGASPQPSPLESPTHPHPTHRSLSCTHAALVPPQPNPGKSGRGQWGHGLQQLPRRLGLQ